MSTAIAAVTASASCVLALAPSLTAVWEVPPPAGQVGRAKGEQLPAPSGHDPDVVLSPSERRSVVVVVAVVVVVVVVVVDFALSRRQQGRAAQPAAASRGHPPSEAVATQTFTFARNGGQWTLIDQPFQDNHAAGAAGQRAST